jgi:DNA-binding NtrC family response regulator
MRLSSHVRQGSSSEYRLSEAEDNSFRPRLLVVDPDEDNRLIVCDRLRAMGFEVITEDDGISGLKRMANEVQRGPIHGVLLELTMPGLGGMAVLQEMRDRHLDVPVIVMSHADDLGRLREAVRRGAIEYLVKPFDSELLKRKCLRAFLGEAYPG